MRILVSGAGGFLGSEIISQLLNIKEVEVIALTSQTNKFKSLAKQANKLIVYDKNDIYKDTINFEKIDLLINCAFPRNDDSLIANGLKYISDLLSLGVQKGVKKVINISSQSVYSKFRKMEARESSELCLQSKYAIGKYATELLTNCICYNIPHTNIRMGSLIGAGFNQRLVNKFVEKVIIHENIQIMGGEQKFGFLDVRDAASAIILVGLKENWQEIYNLGTEYNYTLIEIAKCVMDTLETMGYEKTNIEIENAAVWENSSLDSSRLRIQFSWKQEYLLQDTIRWIANEYSCKGKEEKK